LISRDIQSTVDFLTDLTPLALSHVVEPSGRSDLLMQRLAPERLRVPALRPVERTPRIVEAARHRPGTLNDRHADVFPAPARRGLGLSCDGLPHRLSMPTLGRQPQEASPLLSNQRIHETAQLLGKLALDDLAPLGLSHGLFELDHLLFKVGVNLNHRILPAKYGMLAFHASSNVSHSTCVLRPTTR